MSRINLNEDSMMNKIKAQSTLEYAMVIVCIAGALIAMQFYVKRSIQGRLRNVADEVGEQYSAKTTTSTINQTITSNATVNGDPLIVPNLFDSVTGGRESREFVVTTRTEHQELKQNPGNKEETGAFEKNLFD